ncbi:cupin domain-containing protein [Gephyromycinifex aptenodytis]|uniref:cupin domain-containing protein n=1 Tax=Gephyromycinifex aptenodytis TaxID=2716227 RepID=UPI001445D6CA|nr:cupin domain-containing protein [Gephyromycinifex aptenodytis]
MSDSSDLTDPTRGHVEQAASGRAPGTTDGIATYVEDLRDRSQPRGTRPGAATVLDTDTAKIVAFEFPEGGELKEHAAHHPVLIQVVRGSVDFTLPERTVRLTPGQVLHLTPMLRHAVHALEPTTLTVTMLLPHD